LLQYFLHRDLWKHIDEDKKSAYAYLDSLWFNMYYHGSNIPNVLKWIKSKRIFSRQYVFVPIVCLWVTLIITLCIHSINCQICTKFSAFFFYGSGHWSLLVLCHFDDANCSDIKKGPRMIVLDSLNTTGPTRLQSAIRKYASLILPFWTSK
jgi:Ulp1 family protease